MMAVTSGETSEGIRVVPPEQTRNPRTVVHVIPIGDTSVQCFAPEFRPFVGETHGFPDPMNTPFRRYVILVVCLLAGVGPSEAADPSGIVDMLTFGDAAAEQAHQLTADHSEVTSGLLGVPARQLLPVQAADWQGGKLAFSMKVDPVKPTYFTVRLSGSDRSVNRLILFCEGKQIGYRHLGDIDLLDSPNGAPGFNGRFFYTTNPLPLEMTRGKNVLPFEIRSTGDIYGYASEWEKYQKPFKDSSRGIYTVYTHTEGCFVPPPQEKQGDAPAAAAVRRAPGPEVLATVRDRVDKQVHDLLASKNPLSQIQLWFLARAYTVQAVPAAEDSLLAKKAVETLDRLYLAFRLDPKIAHSEPSVYNSDWFGVGPAAQSVVLLAEPLRPFFDEEIGGAPGVKRRAGWTEMFVACRDWHRENRRQYTNQSMITDTYGIYLANRGAAVLDASKALPEAQTLRYLLESAGLVPWLGSEKDGAPTRPLGDHYYQLTAKGLTKELGFVGYYGEVLDWMTSMYEATRPSPGQPGDGAILAQLVKAAKARALFRHPALDDEGNRAMRAETIVGWRDQGHYPGDITYQERPTWDASAIASAAATLDPVLAGYAQQMFGDNQFFASVAEQLKTGNLRQTAGLLSVPSDYERLSKLPPSAARLPMTAGQPDFAWADEEDGVLALKHGDENLYVSLYWRARYAINFLARVHYITPRVDHIAVVREEEQFEPSGQFWTRPDWVNMGFGGGGMHYPGDLHSAMTGEKLPIAKIPEGVGFRVGDESPYAGRASFYQLRYGPYLIGMNASAEKSYDLPVPASLDSAPELVSGQTVPLRGPVKVAPRSTVVLYVGQTN
jgi:hypothetical protein